MAFENKALEAVDESDLQALITDGVTEGKTIEYKQELPGNDYEAVREFLSDVSSFANAAGGHLIFGVREDGGLPVEIDGLQNINVDQVKQRLENSIRDNMEPRLPGISVQEIPLQSGEVVIIIRIAKIWALPHVVKFQRTGGFTLGIRLVSTRLTWLSCGQLLVCRKRWQIALRAFGMSV